MTNRNTRLVEAPATVDVTPSWASAARIIALALENGTDKGRAMARDELFRMADLLDSMLKGER